MRVTDSATMIYLRLFVFCLIPILGFASDTKSILQSAIDQIENRFFSLINRTRCVLIPKKVYEDAMNPNKIASILNTFKSQLEAMEPSRDKNMNIINHIIKLIKCEYYKEEAANKTDVKNCIEKVRLENGGRRGNNLKGNRRNLRDVMGNINTREYSITSDCMQLPIVLQACLDYNNQSYSCLSGNGLYNLKSMCDGRNDCADGSDEQHCAERVSELLQNTIRISNEVREALKSANCFENFNASYNKLFDLVTHLKIDNNIQDTVEALNQVIDVLSKTFCNSVKPLPIVYEEVNKKSTCVCQSGVCKGSCEAICNGICEHRLMLAEFECPDGGGRTVPMASLCDGHTDCDDHSDEIDCSGNETNRKFLAYGLLRKLSEDLNKLMTSQGNFYVFPYLLNLQKNLIELQRNVTAKFARESVNVKIFESLENVLPRTINTNEISLNEVDHLYNLLKIFKNDLTLLFKLMGRAQKQESAEGFEDCQCHGRQCLAAECGVPCERTCAAHSAALTYACQGDQKRIRLAALCDHTRQCRNGDDETQCATDKCQRYHLMAIINDIKILDEYDGVFGDSLNKWIIKASERVENASKELTMPTRLDVLKLIEVLLSDLRIVYYKYFSSTHNVETKARNQDSPQIKLLTNIATKLVNRTKVCQ